MTGPLRYLLVAVLFGAATTAAAADMKTGEAKAKEVC